MRVLINDHVYDSTKDVIAIQLSSKDKENIINMPEEHNIYFEGPESMSEEEVMSLVKEFASGKIFD